MSKYVAAISVLKDLALGAVPNRSDVIEGALSLVFVPNASRDVQDCFLLLHSMACGSVVDLDGMGRCRAAYLADVLGEAQK